MNAGTMPGIDAGHIHVRARLAGSVVQEVSVASRRPAVAAVLRGKPADEAVRLVPLVFALCGRAQGRAAAMALAAARGVETAPHLDATVAVETQREHLWRLLLDLPPMLGMAPQRELFAAAQRAVGAGDRAALRTLLADEFWNHLLGGLAGLDDVPAAAAALLPTLGAARSLAAWPRLTADFALAPDWEGEPAETGAFARWGGQNPSGAGPLAARWQARCAEVWSWAAGEEKVGAGGTASAARNAGIGNAGRALVETARGLLIHEITLDGERIADYVIVAPTEWNFHPRGTLFDWLHGRAAGSREALQTFVAQAVAALDPCVRWELEIE